MSTTQAPWALRKTDPERMAAVLGTLVAAIRQLAAGDRAGHSRRRPKSCIDCDRRRRRADAPIAQPQPLFPRLELAEEAEESRE